MADFCRTPRIPWIGSLTALPRLPLFGKGKGVRHEELERHDETVRTETRRLRKKDSIRKPAERTERPLG